MLTTLAPAYLPSYFTDLVKV